MKRILNSALAFSFAFAAPALAAGPRIGMPERVGSLLGNIGLATLQHGGNLITVMSQVKELYFEEQRSMLRALSPRRILPETRFIDLHHHVAQIYTAEKGYSNSEREKIVAGLDELLLFAREDKSARNWLRRVTSSDKARNEAALEIYQHAERIALELGLFADTPVRPGQDSTKGEARLLSQRSVEDAVKRYRNLADKEAVLRDHLKRGGSRYWRDPHPFIAAEGLTDLDRASQALDVVLGEEAELARKFPGIAAAAASRRIMP
ncbi:MAG: hypothetical protein HY921_12460 [Elusimicrobia bacterium]|nr:hypothetical protein [Elusimicrobiota bacterium]